MFIAVSHPGGVAERSNAAVLKLLVVHAPNGKTWQAFRGFGTYRHQQATHGIGAGIKHGIRGNVPKR
jgi:hypothetical protein